MVDEDKEEDDDNGDDVPISILLESKRAQSSLPAADVADIVDVPNSPEGIRGRRSFSPARNQSPIHNRNRNLLR